MTPATLRIELLGIPRAWVRGQPVEIPGSRKTRALLGYLLLQERPVTRDHLCELLWPHPDDPRAALRWSLSKLRPLLGTDPSALRADRRSIQIVDLDECVDWKRVEARLRTPIAEITTPELEAAAECFNGELLEGHELSDCHRFYDWLMARREGVRRAHCSILGELVERCHDQPESALQWARSLLALDPLDETHHARVVEWLQRLGRPAEAQQQVEYCRELFDAELGVEPSESFLRSGRRFRVAAGVSSSPSSPPRGAARAATAGLFGRVEECAALEGFLQTLGASREFAVVLLEGEPGIGKTRLLEELARRAANHPVRVLAGRSWEAEMVRPFAAWVDMFADLDLEGIDELLLKDVAALLPLLENVGVEDVDEARLFHATATLLARLGKDHESLVLVFDDLQWIDPSSGALLNYVSEHSTGGLGVVCAGRAGEFADSSTARALLKHWNRGGRLRRLELTELEERDAAALARSIRGGVEVEEIVARCGGNPLYLIEMAHALDGDVPDHVQQLLLDRLESLDEASRECARWLAVLGREVPSAWLEDLFSGETGVLLSAITRLQKLGILGSHEDRCDFSHDLMRLATYGELSGAQRTIMHRRCARMLHALPDERGVFASDLAYHAARGGVLELAAESAVRAGERALRFAAPDEAFALAQRGLRDLDMAEPSRGIGATETRAGLLRVMVHAGLGRRDVSFLREALASLIAEAQPARATSVERGAYYLLSIIAEESGDFDAAQRHSLDAERVGRSADDPTRLAALANTARCLVQLEREPLRARQLLGEAKLLAAELGERVLDIPWGQGLLSALEGDTAGARAALEDGARRAAELRNHWAEFECLAGLTKLDLEVGAIQGAVDRHPRLLAAAERLGEGSETPFARALHALALSQQSDAEPRPLETALQALRRADTKGRLAYVLNVAAENDLQCGDFASAARRAREAREAAGQVGRPVQMARAGVVWGLAEVGRGHVQAASALLDRVREDLVRHGPNVAMRAHFMRLEAALGGAKERELDQER